MLGEALSYPRRGDGWLKKIGIGGLLLLFSFLIIPGILLNGYFVRVLRSAALEQDATPPPFDDWGGMLVDGLKSIVISVAYVLVPYIVFLVAIFALSGSTAGSILGIVAGIALVIVAYVVPVATTNFAVHDSVGAAFDFGTVFDAAFTGRYFVAVVLAVVVGGILSFIGGILSLIIIGLFFLFYLQVFIYYLYGTGCGPKLTDEDRSAEPSSGASIEY